MARQKTCGVFGPMSIELVYWPVKNNRQCIVLILIVINNFTFEELLDNKGFCRNLPQLLLL